MALSFAKGTAVLSNWGFVVADIALLAGAGRNLCTWLMVHHKDRTLFDFLQLNIDTILIRKDLIDTTELQRR